MPTQQILDLQAESVKRGALSIWTVYDHPKDFPHSYVARRFEVGVDGAHATTDIVQGELAIIRKSFLTCGLTCLVRNDADEPQILESWI
jgi:hypothetical protein